MHFNSEHAHQDHDSHTSDDILCVSCESEASRRSTSKRKKLRSCLLISLALLPALVNAGNVSNQHDQHTGDDVSQQNLRSFHFPSRGLSRSDIGEETSYSYDIDDDSTESSSSWWSQFVNIFVNSDNNKHSPHQDDYYEYGMDYSQYERDLSSRSSDNSRDRNFWKLYYDDQYWNDRDDDFYKYIGDPKPPSLLPLQRRHVVGFMLASIGVVMGSAGGIGGGGLVIPVLIIIIGFAPRIAIPLGSVTVFGGSLAGLLLNLKRRHPLADRPIIDWDLILVMEPVVLVGTLFGGILHRVFSEKLLTILLVLLLSIVAHMTLSKAKRMSAAELRYLEHLKAARLGQMSRIYSFRSEFRASTVSADAVNGNAEDDIKMEIPIGNPPAVSPHSVGPVPIARTQSIESQTISPTKLNYDERQRILILNPDFVTLRSDLIEQEKATPRSKIIALMGKFTVLMFLNITLGGGSFRSPWGIQCGSVAFWVVHVIMVAFLLSSAWAAQTYLVNRHEIKEIVRYDFVHGDIKWEPKNAIIYPSFFLVAGLCAGTLGIGCAMVTCPILLSMGVHPAVVTATSSSMVFFTAALSTSSFAVFDLILWDYAAVCFAIGFFGSLFGFLIFIKARHKTSKGNFERNSFIAYGIGFVILLSALLMTLQYILLMMSYDMRDAKEEGGLCEGYRIN